MQVRGIHHVNVNVGFTALPRPAIGRPGAWLAIGAHQLHLADPSGNRIEVNDPGV